MSYKEYAPSTQLAPYIDAYWLSKGGDGVTESRILPDGYVDIIFDLDRDVRSFSDRSIRVSGMMTTYRDVVSGKNSETLGVRFKTGQFCAVSKMPLSEIKNKTISAAAILPRFNDSILEALIEKDTPADRLEFLKGFLSTQINWSNSDRSSLELSVCSAIQANYQSLDLVKIAPEHGVSLRQLERRFKANIGVTMKEYHTIVRFNKTIESISLNPGKSLLSTAFDHGYFDHSHLTKEINRMAGKNPSLF